MWNCLLVLRITAGSRGEARGSTTRAGHSSPQSSSTVCNKNIEEPSNIENMRKLFPFPTSESKTRALGSSVWVVRGLWQKIPSDISDTWHKVFALCPHFHRKVMPAAAIYLWDSPSSSVPPSSVSSERTLLKNLPLFSSNWVFWCWVV